MWKSSKKKRTLTSIHSSTKAVAMPSVDELEREIEECAHALQHAQGRASRLTLARDPSSFPLTARLAFGRARAPTTAQTAQDV